MQIKMSFYGYWKMRLLYGKADAERWKKVYEILSELDEMERCVLGVAHTGENKSKVTQQNGRLLK